MAKRATRKATSTSPARSRSTAGGDAPAVSSSSKRRSASQPDEDKEWIVESILGVKRFSNDIYVHIKWEDWLYEDSTWEPLSNIDESSEILEPFLPVIKKLKASIASKRKPGKPTQENDEWDVEDIIGVEVDEDTLAQCFYSVLWLGCPLSQVTLEPYEHVQNCDEIIKDWKKVADHILNSIPDNMKATPVKNRSTGASPSQPASTAAATNGTKRAAARKAEKQISPRRDRDHSRPKNGRGNDKDEEDQEAISTDEEDQEEKEDSPSPAKRKSQGRKVVGKTFGRIRRR